MQIKPHQIPHFARQRERLAEIRNKWNAEPKEEGSYFSKIFDKMKQYLQYHEKLKNLIKDGNLEEAKRLNEMLRKLDKSMGVTYRPFGNYKTFIYNPKLK